MLVLTRRLGERIKIGDDVSVVVLEIKGGQVRLGIEASSAVPVHREEIWKKIKQQREEEDGGAARADAPPVLHGACLAGER
ncbi:carbon storage regulator CsrA [Candidatus Parcubacteria bacterium]|nr:carbon storage regulator CsrA [Candidatus Parcubacteria bacterium]